MKKNKTLKRFLAFILCAAMMVTYMPSAVYTFADEGSGEVAVEEPATAAPAQEKKAEEPAPAADSAPAAEKAEEPAPEAEAEPAEETKPAEEPAPDPAPEAEPAEAEEPAPAEKPEAEEPQEPDSGEDVSPTDTDETPEVLEEEEEVEPEEAKPEEESKLNEEKLTFTDNANSVNVKVVAQPGTFPKGTRMAVTPVAKKEVRDAVEDAFGEEAKDFRAVDITFYANGNEVQPEKPVSVKLSTSALDADEALNVLHVEDSGNAEVVDLTRASTTTAQFKADGFSVYVVVETGEDARLKVTFIGADGSTEIDSMLINKRQIPQIQQYIYDPNFEVPEGTVFKGWTTDKNYDSSTTAKTIADVRDDVKAELNKSGGVTEGDELVYYAMVFKPYKVIYQDEHGVLLQTNQVLQRTTVTTNPTHEVQLDYTPYPTGEEGVVAQFLGWQQLKPVVSGTEVIHKVGDSFELTESEYVLKAKTEKGHWFIFEENLSNASYTEPQFVPLYGKATEPADPTRSGYTFDGWYTGDDTDARDGKVSGSKYNFNQTVTENTVVYGKWTPASRASYNVVFWFQRVGGTGYDYSGTTVEVKNATVGNNTYNISSRGSGDNAYARVYTSATAYTDYNDFRGFHLDHYDDAKTVTPEGTTVINVYYNRNTITYNFEGSGSFNGLYGSPFTQWPDPGNNKVWQYTRNNMLLPLALTEFNPDAVDPGSTSNTFNFRTTNYDRSCTLYVYKQKEDGTWSYTNDYLIATAVLGSGGRWYPSETYTGFTIDGYRLDNTTGAWTSVTNEGHIDYESSSWMGSTYHDVYLRYARNQYDITYSDGIFVDGSGNPVQDAPSARTNFETKNGIYYEANINTSDYNIKPTLSGYVFLGWYDNALCAGDPYTFDKMPANSIALYAKWGHREYKVTLHPNDSSDDKIQYSKEDQATTFYPDEGDKIGNVGGERIYWDLVGWYTDESYAHAFNFDAIVVNQTNVKKYGKIYSESEIDPRYPTTVGELNLYAKWRSKLIGSDGIQIEYNANGGSNAPEDEFKYVDQAKANACTASTSPDNDKETVFSHWVVQKWNGSAYEDTSVKVFPGETFTVNAADAKVVDLAEPDEDGNTKTYTIQLKAVYIEKDQEILTHINWYDNYTGGTVATSENIKINEATPIPAAPTRAGYKFLGWIRGVEEQGTTTELTELWLEYKDGKYYYNNKVATEVAADEMLVDASAEPGMGDNYKYHHALYAKWEVGHYNIKFDKNADDATGTTEEMKNLEFDKNYTLNENGFERDGYVFQGWAEKASDKTPKYTDKDTVKNLGKEDGETVTLYAVWLKKAEIDTSDIAEKFAKKTVEGTGFKEKTFEFSIEAVGDAPAPGKTTATAKFDSADTKAIDFGKITFTKADTYTYKVKETTTAAEGDGWTLDTAEKTVTVKVTDNGSGELVATVTSDVEIKNKYKAKEVEVDTTETDAEFAKKIVSGTGFNKKKFEFSIEAVGDAPKPGTTTASLEFEEEGTKAVNFGKITFEKADTYQYKVKETTTATEGDGWTLDTAEKLVTVEVKDNGEGQLEAKVTGVEIKNSYKAKEVEVDTTEAKAEFARKIVSGTGFNKKKFEFSIEAVGDAPKPAAATASLEFDKADTKAVDFGKLTFTKADTYTYKVKETTTATEGDGWTLDTEEKTVTVEVTDNGEGKLEAKVKGVEIKNSYKAKEVEVDTTETDAEFAKKVVVGTGFEKKKFDFSIEAVGDAPKPAVTTASLEFDKADTKAIDFGKITFTEAKTYTYKVKETTTATDGDGWTLDTAEKTVTVEVTDNGTGKLEAKVKGVLIQNNYKAKSVIVDTDETDAEFAKKIVSGTGFKKKTFEFSIEAVGDAPKPTKTTGSLEFDKADTKAVDFGTITFDKADTYTYKVKETTTATEGDGWTLDTEEKTVTVKVTDNGTGKLEAKVTGVEIKNSYKAKEVEVDTTEAKAEFAKKTVEGTGFNKKKFEFSIEAVGDAPKPAAATASLEFDKADTKAVDFGKLTFTKADTYTYKVKETTTATAGDGWTLDTAEKTVTVEVTDNGEGKLEAKVTGVEIKNSYKAKEVEVDTDKTDAEFAKKTVEGTDFKEKTFEFSIEAVGDAPKPSITNATLKFSEADTKAVDFGTITFDKADTYTYKVKETTTATDGDGWTLDTAEKTVTVKVTDNGEGKLEAKVTGVEIKNSYKAKDVEVDTTETDAEFAKKTVEGTGFKKKTFEFSIEAVGDAPKPAAATATLEFDKADTKTVDFGKLTFTKADTYTYKVKETTKAVDGDGWTLDTAEKTVTVKVTDNGEGKLEAKVTGVEIKNSYKANPVEINTTDTDAEFAKKTVEGTGFKAKTFEFSIEAVGDAPKPTKLTGSLDFDKAGTKTIDFGTVKFTEPDTYTYKVKETTTASAGTGWTLDNAEKTVTVEVTDNGDGKLEAKVKGVTITNSFKAIPVTVDTTDETTGIFAEKAVVGKGFKAKKFEFSITAVGDAPKPTKLTGSLDFDKADTKAIDFGTVTFNEAGTYTYKVKETTAAADGWTLDTEEKTVTVEVTDNGDGKLKAEAKGVLIQNNYKASDVIVDTDEAGAEFAKKIVEGTGFKTKTFAFSITAAGDAPKPEKAEGTLEFDEAGTKSVNFGKIKFTEAGTYEYAVKETTEAAEGDGWTTDNEAKTVTVKVTDNGEGKLEAKVTGVEITNSYKAAPVTVDSTDETTGLFAEKTVEGTGFKAKTFEFSIKAAGDAPKPETAKGTAEFDKAGTKTVDFGKITFEEAGTYEYTVQETTKAADGDGWTTDNEAKTVTIKVTDNGEGKLEAKVTGVEITNSYKAAPVTVDTTDETTGLFAEKTVEGTDFNKKTFEFSIEAVDDAPAPGTTEASAEFDKAGTKTIDFGTVTFEEAGTYKYTVKETTEAAEGDGWTTDNEAKTVTVEVTDNGEGQLEAKVTGVEITNSYKANPVTVDDEDADGNPLVTKTVEGEGFDAEKFSFSIEAKTKGAPLPDPAKGTVTMEEAGSKTVDFGAITFEEAGTYLYTIKETTKASSRDWTNDNSEKTVMVVVTDNGEGQLEAKVKGVEVTNTYVELVDIIYDLNGGVYNGSPDDIVETYPVDTWIKIHKKPTREGYTFVEWKGSSYQPGDDYLVTEEHTFVAIWEKNDDGGSDDTPGAKTGDDSGIMGMIGLFGASVAGFLAVLFRRKREQE